MTGRNIKIFYALESILSLAGGIILPVYVYYFRNFGIGLFQVALLAAVFEAAIIIFEIPTGYFADRFGRKISTAIGFVLYSLAGLTFFQFRTFGGFLVAEILMGVGETFISGALEALAVDSLDSSEKNSRLPALFANRTVFKTTALFAGMIVGGFLAGTYLSGLFIPVIALTLSGIVLTLFLSDTTKRAESSSLSEKIKFPSLKSLLGNRLLTALFAVGLFSNLTYEPADQFWQVLFSEIKGIPASYFGLLTAAGLILVVLTAKLTQKLYYRLGWYLTGCFILISAALLISVQASIHPAIAGIVVYFALKELVRPAISANLNRIIESRNRATFLSGYNMVCSVGEVLAGVAAGILASQYGVQFVIILSACSAIAVIGIYFILGFRRQSATE